MLFIRSAQTTSIEIARESFVGGKTNKNRNINEFVNTNGFGDDPDAFFDKTFSSSLDGRDFFDIEFHFFLVSFGCENSQE